MYKMLTLNELLKCSNVLETRYLMSKATVISLLEIMEDAAEDIQKEGTMQGRGMLRTIGLQAAGAIETRNCQLTYKLELATAGEAN